MTIIVTVLHERVHSAPAHSALVDDALVRSVLVHCAVETVVVGLEFQVIDELAGTCAAARGQDAHTARGRLSLRSACGQLVVTREPQHVCPSRVCDVRALQCGLYHMRDGRRIIEPRSCGWRACHAPTAFATVRPQARAISCCPNAHVSGSFGRGTGDSQ